MKLHKLTKLCIVCGICIGTVVLVYYVIELLK